jgi:hypothetical protein
VRVIERGLAPDGYTVETPTLDADSMVGVTEYLKALLQMSRVVIIISEFAKRTYLYKARPSVRRCMVVPIRSAN